MNKNSQGISNNINYQNDNPIMNPQPTKNPEAEFKCFYPKYIKRKNRRKTIKF